MEVTADELAGVTDLFGALTPAELRQAIEELAFKRGEDAPELPIEAAVSEYRLVGIEPGREQGDEPRRGGTRSEETSGDAGNEGTGSGGTSAEEEQRSERLLVPGPTAFPALPPGAEDLPHILEVEPRTIDRDALSERVEERFRREAARAVVAGDEGRIEALLDTSYDLEAWGAVDLADARARLDAATGRADNGDAA